MFRKTLLGCLMWVLFAGVANAGKFDDFFGKIYKDSMKSNSPEVYTFVANKQFGGSFMGGRYIIKTPLYRTGWIGARAPNFSAGCGGIDMYMGSFTFLGDNLVNMFRQIAANAQGVAASYLFNLAMSKICKDCLSQLHYLADQVNRLNQATRNSCELTTNIAEGMFGPPEKLADKSEKGAWAISQTLSSAGDAFKQYNSGGAFSRGMSASELEPITGNLVWNVLKKANIEIQLGLDSGSSDVQANQLRELIMSMTGSVIAHPPIVKPGSGTGGTEGDTGGTEDGTGGTTDGTGNSDGDGNMRYETLIPLNVSFAYFMEGNTNTADSTTETSGYVQVYNCKTPAGSTESDCLEPEAEKIEDIVAKDSSHFLADFKGMKHKILIDLNKLVDAMEANQSLAGDAEMQKFISGFNEPIYTHFSLIMRTGAFVPRNMLEDVAVVYGYNLTTSIINRTFESIKMRIARNKDDALTTHYLQMSNDVRKMVDDSKERIDQQARDYYQVFVQGKANYVASIETMVNVMRFSRGAVAIGSK